MSLFTGSGNPQGDILQFVTMKSLSSAKPQVRMPQTTTVSFERETGQLILSQWPFDQTTRRKPHERNQVILAEGVVQITLAYYDGSQWQNEWTNRKCQSLPQAVRCDLVLQDDQNKRYMSQIIAPVLCSIPGARSTTKETSL